MRDVKFGFNVGEFSEELVARADVEKYLLGAARIENFLVTYSGSLVLSAGTRFVDTIDNADEARFFSFEFSDSVDQTYLIIFTATKIRFVRDGAYVLSGGAPFELAHGYAAADLRRLKAYQQYDQVKFTHPSYPVMLLTRTSNSWTFAAEARNGGVPIPGTVTVTQSGKYIRQVRVLTKGSGYAEGATLTVTDATGTGAVLTPTIDSGSIISVTITEPGRGYTAPVITVAGTGGGSGATFQVFLSPAESELVVSVAAVIDGQETGLMRPVVATGLVDFTQTKGSVTYSWPEVPGAEAYRVYRSLIFPFPGQATLGAELSYIGEVRGRSLTDNNIQPDGTKQPRFYRDPFANGAIVFISVTNGGSGYTSASVLTVTDAAGAGCIAYPIVENGVIQAVYIAHSGAGYTAPTISVSGGSGATFSVTLSPASGNYPATSAIFQQRAVYGGTIAEPMTVWASRAEEFDNHAASAVLDATDPYQYTIDARQVTEMRFLLPMQQGLLIGTRDGIHLLRSEDGKAVTALAAVREPQTFVGTTHVPPELIGDDILYVQEKSRGVRLLQYNSGTRRYEGQEISFLSRHLFSTSAVRAIATTMDSNNQGYMVLEDGSGISMTIQREQQTYAFARWNTKGVLWDCAALNVGTEEHVYFLVKRGNVTAIEYLRPAAGEDPEDQVHLDGALLTPKITPAAAVTPSAMSGTITVTASAGVFLPTDVGKVIGLGGGRGFITAHVSATNVVVELTRDITQRDPLTGAPAVIPAGSWWINPLVSSVSGIPWEGLTVSVIGDGQLQTDKVVSDGTVVLDRPAAIVQVGLKKTAILQTLPPKDAAGKKVNIKGVEIWYKSPGTLMVGAGWRPGAPIPLRSSEPWSEPVRSKWRKRAVPVNGDWESDGTVTIQIEDGMPCEIIQVVVYYEERQDVLDSPDRRR